MSGAIETLRIDRLPNGLTVASDAVPGVESVAVGVYVGSGARLEGAERNGVAHFLEHMVFKGTRRRSAKAIADDIEAVGGALNAWTGREQTAFHARMLRDDLPLAVDVIADMLGGSLFDAEELGRERNVILQEIGQAQDTPDDIVFDLAQMAAFPGQPLGRPVLGLAETVAAIDRDDVIGHLHATYGAEKMTLAAAGAVDHDALLALAEAAFGDWPRGAAPTPEPARYVGGEIRDDRDLEQSHLVALWPAPAADDPRRYAYAVASAVLGDGMSSRLFYEIREKHGLVYAIHSFLTHFADCGTFGVYAGTDAGAANETLRRIGDTMRRAADDLDETELGRAKAKLRASALMARESVEARCDLIAYDLDLFGRVLPMRERLDALEAVDCAAARAAIADLMGGPLTFAAVGPTRGIESYDRLTRRLGLG